MHFPHARAARGRPAVVPLTALAGVLTLALAACGGTPAPQAQAQGSGPAQHHPAAQAAGSARFGPGCGMVPATGPGSFPAMATEPLVTAASHDPLLSHFARDIKQAGLAHELDTAHGITVFVPVNSAYRKLSASQRMMTMATTADLAKWVEYHVTRGKAGAAALASGRSLPTLEGGMLSTARMGSGYEVDRARVLCGNVRTANGTIDIIDTVLIPMH